MSLIKAALRNSGYTVSYQVKTKDIVPRDPFALTLRQVETFLHFAPPKLSNICEVLFLTASRYSELDNLYKAFIVGSKHISFVCDKTYKRKRIIVSPRLSVALERYRPAKYYTYRFWLHQYVNSEDFPLDFYSPTGQHVKDEILGSPSHIWRKSYATFLLNERGVNIVKIQREVLQHSDLRTTMRYIQTSSDDIWI
jgi:site-specific recombinase XerD